MTSIVTRVASTALVGLAALAAFGPSPATAAEPTGTWLTEDRSEEHTSELQSPIAISYAVFCLDRKSVV